LGRHGYQAWREREKPAGGTSDPNASAPPYSAGETLVKQEVAMRVRTCLLLLRIAAEVIRLLRDLRK